MIICVCIGQTTAEESNIFGGRIDDSLSENSVAKSRELQVSLKNDYQIDYVYASPLKRSKETLDIIDISTEVSYNNNLTARSLGIFEGKLASDMRKLLPPRYYKAWERDFFYEIPEGESYEDLYKRASDFLSSIKEQLETATVLIVTHFEIVKCIVGRIQNRPFNDIPYITIEYCMPIVWYGNQLL